MIKLFEQFNNEQEIRDICTQYNIKDYTINDNGSIDVNSSVFLSFSNLNKIPLKFNKINGDFHISHNMLENLENSPIEVNGDFICNDNILTSLKGCPLNINGSFDISYNEIEKIDTFPNYIGRSIYINNNKISFIDKNILPDIINGNFNFDHNPIISLNNFPKIVSDMLCNIENTKIDDRVKKILWSSDQKIRKETLYEISDLNLFDSKGLIRNNIYNEIYNLLKSKYYR